MNTELKTIEQEISQMIIDGATHYQGSLDDATRLIRAEIEGLRYEQTIMDHLLKIYSFEFIKERVSQVRYRQ